MTLEEKIRQLMIEQGPGDTREPSRIYSQLIVERTTPAELLQLISQALEDAGVTFR